MVIFFTIKNKVKYKWRDGSDDRALGAWFSLARAETVEPSEQQQVGRVLPLYLARPVGNSSWCEDCWYTGLRFMGLWV